MKIKLASDGNLSSQVYAASHSAAFRLSGSCAIIFRPACLMSTYQFRMFESKKIRLRFVKDWYHIRIHCCKIPEGLVTKAFL